MWGKLMLSLYYWCPNRKRDQGFFSDQDGIFIPEGPVGAYGEEPACSFQDGGWGESPSSTVSTQSLGVCRMLSAPACSSNFK